MHNVKELVWDSRLNGFLFILLELSRLLLLPAGHVVGPVEVCFVEVTAWLAEKNIQSQKLAKLRTFIKIRQQFCHRKGKN